VKLCRSPLALLNVLVIVVVAMILLGLFGIRLYRRPATKPYPFNGGTISTQRRRDAARGAATKESIWKSGNEDQGFSLVPDFQIKNLLNSVRGREIAARRHGAALRCSRIA